MDRTSKRYFYVLLGSFCITIPLFFYSAGICGNDYWWHIKVGEWIRDHGSVPKTDIFSWYGVQEQIAFTAHEWLSDVILYQVQHVFGSVGIFVGCLFLVGVMLFLLASYTKRYLNNNPIIFAGYLMIFAAVCQLFFYGRPHIFSFFLLFFVLYCLYSFLERPESKLIYLIPLIGCLWSNLHGGSSNMPYLLCSLVLVCGLFQFDYERIEAKRLSKKQIKTLVIVIIATVLMVMVNPYGVHMLLYPYQNMGDGFMMSIISEWASPDAKQLSQIVQYFIPVFFVSISILITKKKIKFHDAILFLFFLVLFFRSIRFVILFLIGAAFFAFPYLVPCKVKKIEKKKDKVAIVVCVGLLGVLCISSLLDMVSTTKKGTLISAALEESFIELIKEEEPKRIFNDYNFGETLIYHDIPVFIDSRADVYSPNILKDAISIQTLLPCKEYDGEVGLPLEELLEKYEFDGIIVATPRPLTVYLKSHPEKYELVKTTEQATYFRVLN